MYLYGKIKFNEACHKRIGSGFSTRSDTNKAVQPQEMAGLEMYLRVVLYIQRKQWR